MSATFDSFKRKAKADRACLREIFEQAEDLLSAIEWVRLSEQLEQIKPVSIIGEDGHRRQVEPNFKRRKKEIRRQAFALLDAGYPESGIPALLGLSRATWWRYRKQHRELTPEGGPADPPGKRPDVSNRPTAVGRPPRAYLDASSGGDARSERELHRLLEEPAPAPLPRLRGDAGERADGIIEELSAIFGRELKPGSALIDWIIDEISIGAFCFELRARDWSYGWIAEAITIASRGRWAPSPGLLEAHVDRALLRHGKRGDLTPENGSTDRMDERSDVSKRRTPVGEATFVPDLHLLPEPIAVEIEELLAI